MNKIAIVADTTQDLTFELGEKYGIKVIPYMVQMGDQHFRDQLDIDTRRFYETMSQYEVLSTGIPPLQDVTNQLDHLVSEGYTQALVITSASKLTGMRQLYEVVLQQYQGLELTIFESRYVGSITGLLSIYAAQLRDQGHSVKEIYQSLEEKDQKGQILALFRSLKYVIRGGRFNKYAGMIGTFLNINPLLTIKDSEVTILKKARGKKKSFQTLVEAVKDKVKGAKSYYMVLFSGDNAEEIAALKDVLKEEIVNSALCIETELSPVLGVHAGPQSVGVSILILD